MPVETATFISQLSATNPLATDPISEGDDQIRLVKEVLQAQITTLGAAALTTTAAELNIIDPKHEWIFSKDLIQSKSSNSPVIGKKMLGKVLLTINKGYISSCKL